MSFRRRERQFAKCCNSVTFRGIPGTEYSWYNAKKWTREEGSRDHPVVLISWGQPA